MFIDQEDSDSDCKWCEYKCFDVFVGYCEMLCCCWQVLFGYFGDEIWVGDLDRCCDSCDNCFSLVELFDGIELVKKFLCVICESGEFYGVVYFIVILCGSEFEKIFLVNYDQLLSYGIGVEYSVVEW